MVIRAQEQEGETAGVIGGRPERWQPAEVLHDTASVATAVETNGSSDPVLEAVADGLSELIPHERLVLYEPDGSIHMLMAPSGGSSEEVEAPDDTARDAAIVGRVTETREPQLLNEVYLDGADTADEDAQRVAPESILAVPLLAQDQLKGVLCLSRRGAGRAFNIKEFKLAMLFGDMAALAVDHAEIRASLEAEVVTDHLTGLHNHRFFQERLAEELSRAHRQRTSVALVLYDIDDFKRINDSYGHQMGDRILQSVAAVSRETSRSEDVICRIGGEEFAIILPGSSINDAAALAERVREGIRNVSIEPVGRVTVSLGVAEGPSHASSPRELITCADFALLEAKRTGKDRVHVYASDLLDEETEGALQTNLDDGERGKPMYGSGTGMGGRLAVLSARGELRSVAQLRMLQSLGTKLNRLNDVKKIGEAITAELRSLIDYHNCQVHLLDDDGETLVPVGFRGEFLDYQIERFPALVGKVGHGVAGHVAQSGQTYYSSNARDDDLAGGPRRRRGVDESILGVPLITSDRVIGTIVVSKLGVDQFDDEDARLLEGLASNAAVALENARLLESERDTARFSATLLELSQRMTRVAGTDEVMNEALGGIRRLIRCSGIGIWVLDRDSETLRLVAHDGFDAALASRLQSHHVPWAIAEPFIKSTDEPFVVSREDIGSLPEEYRLAEQSTDVLVTPMGWAPNERGAIAMLAPRPEASFSERDINFARGISDITSLALGNAARFVELEETYLSTVAALASALEAKDEYTGSHAKALAEMSLIVGESMGLDGERLKWLELGALFHDIGKIGVPSEIIRKPGRLTAAERREMNRHPEIGAQILTPVPFLRPLLPIVRACHERWDGKGYPDGLAGKAIPLEARIIFVCDAFHAMTTTRPYRKALSPAEAVRRLRLASGTQFDPDIVAAFATAFAEER
ncbi:MAG TPA: diguanylate cyclase, partial [Actinomycetota bacterium]|nr:diguanylate cyclase [Actinomycetota bacterium]